MLILGQEVSTRTLSALVLILTGCVMNNFILEVQIRESKTIGNLLTLLQFSFVAFVSFFLNFDFKSMSMPKRKIPIFVYLLITLLFFVISVASNKAFEYHISQPVHMVFRSSSLLASLIIGFTFFRKRYQFGHIVGVLCVTVGVVAMTMAEYHQKSKVIPPCDTCGNMKTVPTTGTPSEVPPQISQWLFGVALLTVSLLLAALLGHIQEWSYQKYGKDWREGDFHRYFVRLRVTGVLYTHLLSLPYFLYFYQDIIHHIHVCNESTPIPLGQIFDRYGVSGFDSKFEFPALWVYMATNLITQLFCILGVYILTESAGTLTTTLSITIRKFVSLVISIIYFQNPFSSFHWLGSSLVFVGGLVYMFGNKKSAPQKQKEQ
ncbi:UDP-N-acetylglucosamine transporter [Planoprotostelium fungivorum]|uniref:UDP-N-acetylglucosamine transporter n=1 Tax=Planoprotostelium fungivorum TaxID=1890364 RepID=A0A2P6NT63_9EUKA|nr:UDP-N-acetylglucosamine transporter [Planoprotostelium fungivorum]